MNARFKFALAAVCGMLLMLPAAQSAERTLASRDVYVDLDTSEAGGATAFPRELDLKVGTHYRLELRNFSDDQQHVVMAPEFGATISETLIRTIPQHVRMTGASVARGIDLPPHARVEIYFTPRKEGRYKLFCEDRAHTASGMDVAINVGR
jgi:uncharacterized cupredoxin-like copper-binding protein